MATGSEVSLAIDAAKQLKLQGIDINPHWRAEQVNVTWL